MTTNKYDYCIYTQNCIYTVYSTPSAYLQVDFEPSPDLENEEAKKDVCPGKVFSR